MKSSNKSSIFTGTVLLLIAALFSFSLILQPLDFGIGGPGHDNFLYVLGNMLVTVYGYCSILIPLFLFIAGISCFATKWTSQKTMRLLTAIIPFFTAVLTEKICRSIISLGTNNSTTIKIVITIVTGLMLIIIEILGAGVIAESVNQRIFYRNGKPKNADNDSDDFEDYDYDSDSSDKNASKENSFSYSPIKQSSAFDKALSEVSIEPVSVIAPETKAEAPETQETATTVSAAKAESVATTSAAAPVSSVAATVTAAAKAPVAEKPAEPSLIATNKNAMEVADMIAEGVVNPETIAVADGVTPEDLEVPVDESFEALVSDAEDMYEENVPTLEDYENVDNQEVETEKTEETAPVAEEAATVVPEPETTPETISEEDAEPANPASIITQEEYAALINPDQTVDMAEPEEMEWPNLPPAPDKLPDDYIDDDDPALNFPPSDDLEDTLPEIDLTSELDEEETEEDDENEEPEEEDIKEEKESPYAAAKYVDSVLKPNPAYPFGITLHDEEETPKKTPAEKKPVRTVPQYPSKISLYDNPETQPAAPVQPESRQQSPYQYQSKVESSQEEEIEDDYVEDPTLPEPDYFNMNEPAMGEPFAPDFMDEEETVEAENNESEAKKSAEPVKNPGLSPDFFDIDMNKQEEIKETPKPSFSSKISSVFSDMDADVRKDYGIVDKPVDEDATIVQPAPYEADTTEISDFADDMEEAPEAVENVIEENNFIEDTLDEETAVSEPVAEPVEIDREDAKNSPELNPNANTAKNLTADELTDFFNAQQAENTPKTHEIEGNLPTTNRATRKGPYVIPSDLLTAYRDDQYWIIDEKTKEASINLKQTLAEFNIDADIIGIKKGPVVTMFELLPAPGVKLSKIVALQDNIALSLAASSVRIVAPIPGKQAVGIEVPNKERSIVSFREIIEMDLPEYQKMAVPVILGKDILGKAQLIDLVKTPHMLIAGATGSGKSVCVNSLILSILYKRSYKDVKLILVDPKVVELKLYNNIPHLLTPVITEPKRALQALQYCLCEMERRYALLDGLGVRDIASYNQRIKERGICTEKLPYIVVIIDEFADLMATSGKELESIVARLTAMSRAVGIHLVLATQRPSVNVITGLIKANIPSRIAFMVASRTDSNIIIDSVGAEKLLGRGDMLYASAVDPYPVRIQGTFVSDSEVENVVNYVKQFGEPDYIDEEIFVDDDDSGNDSVDLFGNAMDEDPLYDQALEIVVQAGKASASYIQRRLKIGYNRAARLVEEMEDRGIVGPANGSKPREIIHMP